MTSQSQGNMMDRNVQGEKHSVGENCSQGRGLCSSSSKGNGEVQKETKCLFSKVMLKQQNEEDRLTVTESGMLRNT